MIEVELRVLSGMAGRPDGLADGGLQVRTEEGTTLGEMLDGERIDFYGMLAVLINGRQGEAGMVLGNGDVVSVFPPVAKRN